MSERNAMILIAAANGNQGKLLVPKLLAADQLVRACVRTQASAEQLRGLGGPFGSHARMT